MASGFHARSISLPSRSHPSTLKIEEQLKAIETSSSSDSICSALSGLEEVYASIDGLLSLASTQQILSHRQHRKHLDELLDASMNLIDICSSTREVMLQTQEQARALHSAFRRRKGGSSMKSSANHYLCCRKKMKRDAGKLISAIKKTSDRLGSSLLPDLDPQLASVVQKLRQVFMKNISIFRALFLLLSSSVSKPKPSGWSLLSKWVHKGVVACEENQKLNEFNSVEAALGAVLGGGDEFEKMQMACKRLECLEMAIQDLESGLESLLRRLIKTRSSLLNILSQ